MDLSEKTIKERISEMGDGRVQSWSVQLGEDSTGDSAVWIRAVLKDTQSFEFCKSLRREIHDAMRELSPERPIWPYVRFALASELEAEATG